jgi:hypothetical protein
MEEQKQAPAKKEMSPDQAMQNHIRTMSNKQMSRRLKRLARSKDPNMFTIRWATVLSIVFDNTKETGGKVGSYLV